MSIRGKLLSLILCISFIPVLVIGYVNFSNFKRVSERQTLNNLEIFAEYKQEKLKLYLAELKTRLTDFASDGFVRDGLEALYAGGDRVPIIATVTNHLLTNKKSLDERIMVIDLMDRDGMVIISTDTARIGRQHRMAPPPGTRQGDVHTTDVLPSGAGGAIAIEVFSAVNSRTDHDRRVGYIAIQFDAGMLDLLMTSQWLMPMMGGARRGGMGESDETYLVNNAGLMINHSRHLDNKPLVIHVDTEPVRRCLADGENSSGQWLNYRGINVIGTARCIDMGGFRWVLLSEIARAEAFSLIDDYRDFFSMALVVVLLLIVVVAIFVTRVISRPISALNQGVQKIALGDLNCRVGTDKQDEIGELARAFDRMVAAFRHSRQEIESINENLRHANHELNFMREAMDQHAIIVETDISGVITRANQKFRDISQYSDRELIGRTHRVINSGYHPRAFFQELWSTISAGRVWHGDIRNRRKDGTLYWVRTTIVPYLNAGGGVERYISLRTDISHQKQVEEKLTKSNRALLASARIQKAIMSAKDERQLLDNVCHFLVKEGRYRFAWVGYARHDKRKSVQPMAQAGDDDGYLDQVAVTWGDGESGCGPGGLSIRQGREIVIADVTQDERFARWREPALQRGYLSVIALPFRQEGQVFGMLAIYAAECNAFDADEIELLKLLVDDIAYGIAGLRIRREHDATEAALRESEINLKRAQEIAHLGSWEWNQASDKFIWSDEQFRILGYRPGAVKPSLEALLAAVVPEQRETVAQQIYSCIEDGRSRSLTFSIVRADGELRYLSSQLVVYCGCEDGVTRIAGTLMDITEQKRSESERQSLQNQLQHAQKLHSIGQLTGGVAHDFNNILSSIMGYTTLAIEECPVSDSEYLGYLGEISKAGVRAKQLIAQLMTFSRRDSHETEVIRTGTLVQDAFRMIKTALPAAIEFKLDVESGLPPVRGNQVKLHQVITNLVINARDAIDGSGQVILQARCREMRRCLCTSCQQSFSGDYIEFTVSDSGKGIADEHLVTIFEPFFSTKEVGKGTGMGLSMVHGLVHSHNGHIRVESAPGEGSRFSVYLPVCREIDAPSAGDEAAETAPLPRAVNGNATILLVDDEKAITRMLGDLLGRYGYRCIEAHSPDHALALFLNDPDGFDLVISDQVMPQMEGLELARRMLARRPDLPIILCTGFSGEIGDQDVVKAGLKGLLEKPIDLKQLLGMVDELLVRPGGDTFRSSA